MGVHGLWRLIEPSGKPVPLESLENKVLAVDVSIWLHQLIKGFQDNRGASLPNAHLLGIYHRVCKLLYFRIKPVFVFDGGVPVLKRNTIALRNQQKLKSLSEADRIHKNLLQALIKHTAISKVLSEKAKAAISATTSPKKSKTADDNLYVLPPSQLDSTVSSSNEDSDEDTHPSRHFDLHSIDTQSAEFKSLPADVRHEILTDLKDTRKQSSWGRIHELPTESTDFSSYQMKRLMKRQSVQTALEEVEKEMGGHTLSLGELEKLLKDQGVITNLKGSRIASDENTRFLLIKDIKQAIVDAKKQDLATVEEVSENEGEVKEVKNKGDEEFEDDLKKAIALSLEEVPSTSKEEPSTSSAVKKIGRKGKKRMSLSFLADFEDADFGESESSEEEEFRMRLTPAQRYMMEYSGLTAHAISKIIESNSGTKKIQSVNVSSTSEEKEEIQEKKLENEKNLTEKISITSEQETEENNKIDEDNKVSSSEEHKIESSEEVVEMSDSDSEDFVDVETKEEPMEVVIKPDEKIEDDLFKDVFENSNEDISSTQEKNLEPVKQLEIRDEEKLVRTEEAESRSEDKEEVSSEVERTVTSKSTSQSMMDKIEKMIETYSKPQQKQKTNENKSEQPKISTEQLNEMQENLQKEQDQLIAEKSTKERLAGNITDQMCQEAQELLELFGVPYIVAPMEAEAQCAFLDLIDLTDGTITDDSDIWLFGGQTVYKNFFDQNKIVMEFKAENIQQHYQLTREQMILLAMLVGSDYTTGLTGVGPVTALEILAAFPPKNQLVSGLAEFKAWFNKGKRPGPGRTSLRGKLKNIVFCENFPNPQIVQAYLEPTVETSKEKFSWAKPDVPGLVEFARQKFGWSKIRSEEILQPILRRMEDARIQKSITDYFKLERKKIESGGAEKMMSKRVKAAVSRMAKGFVDGDEEEEKKIITKKVKPSKGNEEPKAKKKRQTKKDTEDEVKILKEVKQKSKKRVEEIANEVSKEIEQKKQEKVNLHRLHKKEVIPQKQKDKSDMLKNKLKAIETFRKSKQGPGYTKKRAKSKIEPKKDAGYLSEDSSD